MLPGSKLLSVVVPTYNMEEYLPRCLSSVTDERVPNTLEVIVVNDGSTDCSLEIVKEFQNKRPDIVSIIDKPNGHYGSCINAALPVATGKYFRMLDADDCFDTDALVSLLERLTEIDVDLIVTLRTEHKVFPGGVEITSSFPCHGVLYNKVYDIQTFDIHQQTCGDEFNMHSMAYKTQVLRDIGLKHLEGICYTDTQYCFFPIDRIRDFMVIDLHLYHYYIGRIGASTEKKSVAKNFPHITKVLLNVLEYYDNNLSDNPITRKNQCHFIQIALIVFLESLKLQTTISDDVYHEAANAVKILKKHKIKSRTPEKPFYKIWKMFTYKQVLITSVKLHHMVNFSKYRWLKE